MNKIINPEVVSAPAESITGIDVSYQFNDECIDLESNESEGAYLSYIDGILRYGNDIPDRTGTGTKSIFGISMDFDKVEENFPLLTTKKIPLRLIAEELAWFLRGETNIKSLVDANVHIWDEWADAAGELGPVYGSQWRDFNGDGIDQISQLISDLKTNPYSRRHIVTAWNPSKIKSMALPPCHLMVQFSARPESHPDDPFQKFTLDACMYQRSGDMFLGVPFNIASYALLMIIIAKEASTDKITYTAGNLMHVIGDAHIYKNHFTQVQEQITRTPRDFPRLVYTGTLKQFMKEPMSCIELENYNPWPAIKGEVSV